MIASDMAERDFMVPALAGAARVPFAEQTNS
jgi:hypothetical protein